MKKTALFLSLLLTFAFILLSCGEEEPPVPGENPGGDLICTEHADANGDGLCDKCDFMLEGESGDGNEELPPEGDDGENTGDENESPDGSEDTENEGENEGTPESDDLALIKDGVANFIFIYEKGIASDAMKALNGIITSGEKIGLDISVASENMPATEKIEVLVGCVKNRGDAYLYDIYSLGPNGYAIIVNGEKVQILGGSDDALTEAVEIFKKDFLKITKKTEKAEDVILTEDMTVIEKQTDFSAERAIALGRDLSEFKIYANEAALDFAKYLQDYYYENAGKYLEITDDQDADSVISILFTSPTGGEGFEIITDDGGIYITCEFPEKFLNTALPYIGLNRQTKEINIKSGLNKSENLRDISYSDFNAEGDGSTNDYKAIYDTHVYANEHGHRVVCENRTYYIGTMENGAIPIKSDVDFGKAKFIIDDSFITPTMAERDTWLFEVLSDSAPVQFKPNSDGKAGETISAINAAGGIKKDSFDKIDLGLGYAAMIIIKNANHKNYIRYGSNANSGAAQEELVLIDENGNVDKNTPLLFDYTEITSITVYKIDDKAITISGGSFETVANQAPSEYTYYKRGINVTRSNTVIDGITHTVTGEGDTGAPYSGFISVSCTNNVTVKNCLLTGRKTYYNSEGVSMGTYDLGIGNSNNTLFFNCDQTNFFIDEENKIPSTSGGYWGIGGSNYSKNLTYDECRLTRFDAHCGVYNANLLNSEVAAINLIGGGTARIENTTLYTSGANLITLRSDYGSTWNGDIIIKDVTVVTSTTASTFSLIHATYTNHDFGYPTYLPTNITVDNFVCESARPISVNIFAGNIINPTDYSSDFIGSTENLNPYAPTKTVTVKNNTAGYTFYIPPTDFFGDTQLTLE